MTSSRPAARPSDPNSSCPYCRPHSVGTPLADSLVCACETACAAARCAARDEREDCAGRCGKRIPRNRTACVDCWNLLPPEMREAVKIRRGPMRAAVIAKAREWYAQNVSEGRLNNPPPPPTTTITLTDRGSFMSSPSEPTDPAPNNDSRT